MQLMILSGMNNLANYAIASELIIEEIQCTIKFHFYSPATILPVQIKQHVFYCVHCYTIA